MIVLDTDPNLDNYDLDGNHNAMYAYNGIPFTGIVRSFHTPTTQVESEFSYVDGLWWGLQKIWWPNGQLRNEYSRGIGGLNGLRRSWDEQGNLIYSKMWIEGEEQP